MRSFYSERLLPTFRGRKHRFSFDLTVNAYDGAPLSCNFHIFFTACTLQNSHVEALAYGKIKSGRKSLVKKKNEKEIWTKEERKKEYHSAKKRKKFLRDSDQSPSNRNLPHIMLKRKSLFFILVTALYTNMKSRLEL